MVSLWGEHRRSAQRACYRLSGAQRNEAEHRSMLRQQFRDSAGRGRNLFWAAVAGAAWVSRSRSRGRLEQRNPLVELAAAGLLAWRWRSLQERVAAALIEGSTPANSGKPPEP